MGLCDVGGVGGGDPFVKSACERGFVLCHGHREYVCECAKILRVCVESVLSVVLHCFPCRAETIADH